MARRGFPRSIRLRRSADFRVVRREGRRLRTQHLVVFTRPKDDPVPRFGLSVSRKVGNAVARNRVKRWLRESIRTQRRGVGCVDVVFIARPSASDAGLDALRAEVGTVLDRLRESRR